MIKQEPNIWSEINSNNYDPINYTIDIIGYQTDNQLEVGNVIAQLLFKTQYDIEVHYKDERAKTDTLAQQHIKQAVEKWECRGVFPSKAILVYNTLVRKYGQLALIDETFETEGATLKIVYHYEETPGTRCHTAIEAKSQHFYKNTIGRINALEKALTQYKNITLKIIEETNNEFN